MGLGFCCKSLEFFKCPSPLLPMALTPGRNFVCINCFRFKYMLVFSKRMGDIVSPLLPTS